MKAKTKSISVIIVAHKRKQFLLEAVNSVLKQSFNKNLYEIIVVKNFRDFAIDKILANEKVENFYTKKSGLMEKFYLGMKHSSGDIICFLEDDDLFDSKKLNTVNNLFRKNKNLVFYHNNSIDVDANLKRIQIKRRQTPKRLIIQSNINDSLLKKLLFYGSDVNNSSITIRKSKYIDHLINLRSLVTFADSAMFFLALAMNKELIIDNKKLTLWRRHQSSSMNINNNLKGYFDAKSVFKKNSIYGVETFLKYVKDTFPHSSLVIKYCEIYKKRWNFSILALRDKRIPLKLFFWRFFDIIKNDNQKWKNLIGLLLRFFSWRLYIKVYHKTMVKLYRKSGVV